MLCQGWFGGIRSTTAETPTTGRGKGAWSVCTPQALPPSGGNRHQASTCRDTSMAKSQLDVDGFPAGQAGDLHSDSSKSLSFWSRIDLSSAIPLCHTGYYLQTVRQAMMSSSGACALGGIGQSAQEHRLSLQHVPTVLSLPGRDRPDLLHAV